MVTLPLPRTNAAAGSARARLLGTVSGKETRLLEEAGFLIG